MEKLPAWSQSTLDRDVPLQSLLYDIFQKHILKARFFYIFKHRVFRKNRQRLV